MMNNSVLDMYINNSPIIDYFKKSEGKLYNDIKIRTTEKILSMNAKKILTLVLKKDGKIFKVIKPSANKEFASILIAFIMKKKYKDFDVDSFLTPEILKVIEECVLDFYGNSKSVEQISNVYQIQLAELSVSNNVTTNLSKSKSLAEEIRNRGGKMAMNYVGDVAMSKISSLLATTSSTAIGVIIAKVLTSSVVVSVLKPIVIKVLGTLSLATIAKLAIGKALIAVLGLVGISSGMPILWILLPLLVGFLAYEISNLPNKMAEQLPEQIVEGIKNEFDTMNNLIVNEMMKSLNNEIQLELLKQDTAN